MDKHCLDNIEKLGNHDGRIKNLESYKQEDKQTKERIFTEIKETNNRIGILEVSMNEVTNGMKNFTTNMTENYTQFKEDMNKLFDSLFTKAIVALVVVTVLKVLLELIMK